jgi:hypothetical protein
MTIKELIEKHADNEFCHPLDRHENYLLQFAIELLETLKNQSRSNLYDVTNQTRLSQRVNEALDELKKMTP